MLKKTIALLLALVLLCLCGCSRNNPDQQTTPTTVPAPTAGQTQPTQDPAQDNVSLELWIAAGATTPDAGAVKAALEEFNAYYPNILVDVKFLSPDQVGTDRPDVILADAQRIDTWQRSYPMVDLAGEKKALASDLYTAAAACSDYAMPMYMVVYCMALNAQMLEDSLATQYVNLGNRAWATVNFTNTLSAMAESGIDSALTLYCQDMNRDDLTRLLVANLYAGGFVNGRSGAFTFNASNNVRALNALRQYENVRFDANATADEALNAFLKGQSAMVLNWNSALVLEHGEEEFLFMGYPASGQVYETVADIYGFGIFDSGDPVKNAAATTLVRHLATSDTAARAMGQLSARISAEEVFVGTALEGIMTELNKLLEHLGPDEPTNDRWEEGRRQWKALLTALAGEPEEEQTLTDFVTAAVEACQSALEGE